ncbi:MAG: cyclase family protein [Pyrinomonadaceae bacterium]
MILSIQTNNQTFEIDGAKPIHIAIPLNFNGAQPNAYGVEKALSKPCKTGEIIGDTRRGGSCNFEQIKFIPHCNGTHTESVGHITRARISVHDCLKDSFILANLISVETENANETNETYAVKLNENDQLITRKTLENARRKMQNAKYDDEFSQALIIRTLPNDESKLSKTYFKQIPPFFSTEAMQFIAELKIKHLLVDAPSIDRIFDDGKLSNHRIFWNVEQGSFEVTEKTLAHNTITELIYVANEIEDGVYLLNLQVAPFATDAAPSRPVIFRIGK